MNRVRGTRSRHTALGPPPRREQRGTRRSSARSPSARSPSARRRSAQRRASQLLATKALCRRPSHALLRLLDVLLHTAGVAVLRRRPFVDRAQHPARNINDLSHLKALIPRVRIRLPEAMRHGDVLAVAELAQVVALDPQAMKAELLALNHAH